MKIQKPIKQHIVVPVISGNGYKCTCGNRLTGYRSQGSCEICKAVFDWDKAVEIDDKKKGKWNRW